MVKTNWSLCKWFFFFFLKQPFLSPNKNFIRRLKSVGIFKVLPRVLTLLLRKVGLYPVKFGLWKLWTPLVVFSVWYIIIVSYTADWQNSTFSLSRCLLEWKTRNCLHTFFFKHEEQIHILPYSKCANKTILSESYMNI